MKTVTREQVSTLRMVAGNEKKHPRVILDDHVQNWVGFGWVDEGPATKKDKKKYPTVED